MNKSLMFICILMISLTNCQPVKPVLSENQLLSVLYASPDCERFGETVQNDFIQTYDHMGCKLATPSPDGRYVAYVTLSRQQDGQEAYFTDTVKVLTAGQNDPGSQVHIVLRKDHVSRVEWTPTGQLMVWEAVWEGDWVLFVYDTFTGKLLTRLRTDQPDLQWNIQHTAFYSVYTGNYGKDVCVTQLSGYDFETGSPFPDLYEFFQVQRSGRDSFSLPYSTENDLNIEPFGWSDDGNKLFLTITSLVWKGNEIYEYEIGPRQAGVIELSDAGITYSTLNSSLNLDYSFGTSSDPEVVSKPYSSKGCP